MDIAVKAYATLVHDLIVSLPEVFPPDTKAGTPVSLRIEDGANAEDLLEVLDLAGKKPLLVFRNGKALSSTDRLLHGDVVGIFPPVGGG